MMIYLEKYSVVIQLGIVIAALLPNLLYLSNWLRDRRCIRQKIEVIIMELRIIFSEGYKGQNPYKEAIFNLKNIHSEMTNIIDKKWILSGNEFKKLIVLNKHLQLFIIEPDFYSEKEREAINNEIKYFVDFYKI